MTRDIEESTSFKSVIIIFYVVLDLSRRRELTKMKVQGQNERKSHTCGQKISLKLLPTLQIPTGSVSKKVMKKYLQIDLGKIYFFEKS